MKNLQVRTYSDLATEPVTATEAKLFCKVTGATEDDLFTILIKAARQSLEKYTGRSFGSKTLHAFWLQYPSDYLFELPYGPVSSVDHVYYIDEEGTEEEAVLNEDYWVYGDTEAVVKMTQYWSTGLKKTNSVRIEYTAGYGTTGCDTLPSALKLAILKEIESQYVYRENVGASSGELCNSSKNLARPYRSKIWF